MEKTNVTQYKNYQERFEAVNKDSDTRPVIESIDKPIRQLVLEINRIGLKTLFSCCGFNYPNEEEPKSHGEHPYVFFRGPETEFEKDSFFKFCYIAKNVGWGIMLATIEDDHVEWMVYYDRGNSFWKNTGSLQPLHAYETFLVGIDLLTKKVVSSFPYGFERENTFKIEDGNKTRLHYEGWLIQPKVDSIVKVGELRTRRYV
jgi:hypothetical protein